jgi:hypothetical protein
MAAGRQRRAGRRLEIAGSWHDHVSDAAEAERLFRAGYAPNVVGSRCVLSGAS